MKIHLHGLLNAKMRFYFLRARLLAMRKNIAYLFLLATFCAVVSGCGTKGPLYIPEQQYPQPAEK